VAGYSRLIGADEEGTLSRLRTFRAEVIDPKIAEHHGRIVKTTGDGLLAEFASVVDALRCAVEIQTTRIRTERRIGSSSPIGQDLMNVVERHAEQLFEFLARRESTPPGMREAGARVSEARQSDGAAVVGADAGLARSADGAAGLIRASTSSCFRV